MKCCTHCNEKQLSSSVCLYNADYPVYGHFHWKTSPHALFVDSAAMSVCLAGLGIILMGFGLFFLLFGVMLYFDTVLLAFGNVSYLFLIHHQIGKFTFFANSWSSYSSCNWKNHSFQTSAFRLLCYTVFPVVYIYYKYTKRVCFIE